MLISIHSTTRVETYPQSRQSWTIIYFNPLHHEGGDVFRHSRWWLSWQFQSTPPRGWRQLSTCKVYPLDIFQSTPPRGWRHKNFLYYCPAYPISIHSTTRVETTHCFHTNHNIWWFQSTPPRGWRRSCSTIPVHLTHFNPLHHEGGDVFWKNSNSRDNDFNPLHHEGGDSNTTQ